MKKAIVPVLVVFFLSSCHKLKDYLPDPHQPLPAFNKVFGGNENDVFRSITAKTPSGYVMAGYTNADAGDPVFEDALVVKLDNDGNLMWQKTFGGSRGDQIHSIIATQDGGYVMAGFSSSNDGDASGNHGGDDAWIVKIDQAGTVLWQKQFGSPYTDVSHTVIESGDGGYVVAASLGGEDSVTGYHISDAWIFKLDNGGNLIWQKTFGGGTGMDSDEALTITKSSYGGYVMAGLTYRGATDTSFGNYDVLAVKLHTDGNVVWQKTFGMPDKQEVIWSMTNSLLVDGYVLAGYIATHNNDGHDALVLKLDENGDAVWQKTYGGSSADWVRAIKPTLDGGYILAGATHSTDGDVSGNHGNWDAWVLKLDYGGTLKWQKALGGSGFEEAYSIAPRTDGRYVVAGSASSTDGDLSVNHGNMDAWVIMVNGK